MKMPLFTSSDFVPKKRAHKARRKGRRRNEEDYYSEDSEEEDYEIIEDDEVVGNESPTNDPTISICAPIPLKVKEIDEELKDRELALLYS